VVIGAHERASAVSPPAEPVVVAVVDVNHVERFLTDQAAEPSEVGEDGSRARPDIEMEPLDGLHAGFARLRLELVSGGEAEQRVRAAASSGATRMPVSLSVTTSGMPPTELATAGTRAAKAWSNDCGTPSVRVEARTKQSMIRRRSGTSLRNPVKTTASPNPRSRARPSTHCRRIPSPTRSSRAVGQRSRTMAKA